MPIEAPKPERIRAIARSFGMELDEAEAQVFAGLMGGLKASYDALDRLPEPDLPVKYPRTSGYRPGPEENPYNAWYWKCEIRGAPDGPLEQPPIGRGARRLLDPQSCRILEEGRVAREGQRGPHTRGQDRVHAALQPPSQRDVHATGWQIQRLVGKQRALVADLEQRLLRERLLARAEDDGLQLSRAGRQQLEHLGSPARPTLQTPPAKLLSADHECAQPPQQQQIQRVALPFLNVALQLREDVFVPDGDPDDGLPCRPFGVVQPEG